jgi:hypothetical protein
MAASLQGLSLRPGRSSPLKAFLVRDDDLSRFVLISEDIHVRQRSLAFYLVSEFGAVSGGIS